MENIDGKADIAEEIIVSDSFGKRTVVVEEYVVWFYIPTKGMLDHFDHAPNTLSSVKCFAGDDDPTWRYYDLFVVRSLAPKLCAQLLWFGSKVCTRDLKLIFICEGVFPGNGIVRASNSSTLEAFLELEACLPPFPISMLGLLVLPVCTGKTAFYNGVATPDDCADVCMGVGVNWTESIAVAGKGNEAVVNGAACVSDGDAVNDNNPYLGG